MSQAAPHQRARPVMVAMTSGCRNQPESLLPSLRLSQVGSKPCASSWPRLFEMKRASLSLSALLHISITDSESTPSR
eukprot:37625-Rhodomonas_salina.3